MERALNEAKIQAKLLFKGYKNKDPDYVVRLVKWHKSLSLIDTEVKLKHCQVVIARELGFKDWQALQNLFSGNARGNGKDLDFGALFYTKACAAFVNKWFTTYDEAKAVLGFEHYLLPYKKQFTVVSAEYIAMLGISNAYKMRSVNHDLFASYPSETWDELALQALRNRR
ncbi:hypothetical protein AAD001_01895 [Colwelliaceae bacterium 6471]